MRGAARATSPLSDASSQFPCKPKRMRIGMLIVATGPSAIASASNSSRSVRCSSRRLQSCTIHPSPSDTVLWRGTNNASCRLGTGLHRQCRSVPVARALRNRQFIEKPQTVPPRSRTRRRTSTSSSQPCRVGKSRETVVDAREFARRLLRRSTRVQCCELEAMDRPACQIAHRLHAVEARTSLARGSRERCCSRRLECRSGSCGLRGRHGTHDWQSNCRA
jgi:hypothetical protein